MAMQGETYESALHSPQHYCRLAADFLESHPDAWVRGTYAVDHRGFPCDPRAPEAARFCAMGLVMKFVRDRRTQQRMERLLARTVTPVGSTAIVGPANFNDQKARDVHDVIAMFRGASFVPEVAEVDSPIANPYYQHNYAPIPATEEPLIDAEVVAAIVKSVQVPDWLKFQMEAANDDLAMMKRKLAEPPVAA